MTAFSDHTWPDRQPVTHHIYGCAAASTAANISWI